MALSLPFWAQPRPVSPSDAPPASLIARPPALRLQGLRKRFGATQAVDGLSLEVARGEAFGLLGPNGAGKTTTLHMVAGLCSPDAGSIEVCGRRGQRRLVGMAPQALAVYPELSAEENLAFFATLHDLRGARLRRQVDWALELVGLLDRASDRVSTYSGGMQRRLNLACAIVHGPELLLLDEPTVGVDPQSRNKVLTSLEALAAEGTTLVYSTHYMEEAARLCDRVAIVDHGRLLDVGTVEQLIDRHGGSPLVRAQVRAPLVELPDGARLHGDTLVFHSDQPLDVVARLRAQGAVIDALHIERPSLETVFLSLTGRRLRD